MLLVGSGIGLGLRVHVQASGVLRFLLGVLPGGGIVCGDRSSERPCHGRAVLLLGSWSFPCVLRVSAFVRTHFCVFVCVCLISFPSVLLRGIF